MYYSDHCAVQETTQDSFIGISRMPVHTASTSIGESAVLCPKCYEDKLTFYISFTRTFHQWLDGHVKLPDTPCFTFGCVREHALCADNMMPNDIAMALRIRYEDVADGHLVDVSKIKKSVPFGREAGFDALVAKWVTFKLILKEAADDGRIWWKDQSPVPGEKKPFFLNEIATQLRSAGYIVKGD